jgi:hypothetical protein
MLNLRPVEYIIESYMVSWNLATSHTCLRTFAHLSSTASDELELPGGMIMMTEGSVVCTNTKVRKLPTCLKEAIGKESNVQ